MSSDLRKIMATATAISLLIFFKSHDERLSSPAVLSGFKISSLSAMVIASMSVSDLTSMLGTLWHKYAGKMLKIFSFVKTNKINYSTLQFFKSKLVSTGNSPWLLTEDPTLTLLLLLLLSYAKKDLRSSLIFLANCPSKFLLAPKPHCFQGLTCHHHHHHHPRISSWRKSWNKTSGPLCVTYYTTAVMSMLLWPIVCIAVWSAEQFRFQGTLNAPRDGSDVIAGGSAFQAFAAATGKARLPMVLCNDRGTCSDGDDADRRRLRDSMSATRCSSLPR